MANMNLHNDKFNIFFKINWSLINRAQIDVKG